MVRLLSLLTLCLWSFSDSFAQTINLDKPITVSYKQQSLGVVLKKLEQKYQLKFSYSNSLLSTQKKITLQVNNKPLKYALKQLFDPIKVRFALIGNQIVLKKEKSLTNNFQQTPNIKRPTTKPSNKDRIIIQVFDASTSNPIPKVHIIHVDSIIIGNSDRTGIFRLNLKSKKEFALKFTHIGYEKTSLAINPQVKRKYIVWMIPKVERLAPITISINRDKRWKKLFNKFKNDFLGTSSNASQCKILNPWVVEFIETPEGITLKKNSIDTLEIENYALGYKVLFLLNRFDLAQNDVHYRGRCQFLELIPKNRKQNRRWLRNRRRAYRGSLQHFLKSLANKTTSKEGFEVLFSKQPPGKNNGIFFTIDLTRIIKPGPQVNQYILTMPYYMKVIYNRELEEYNYLKWYKKSNPWLRGPFKPRNQSSWMYLKTSTLTFDRQGNILDSSQGVIRYGYWAWERVGEMIPSNNPKEEPQSANRPRKR
ncbi:hypothetical protein BKI52_17710 [marine bacterium AO1-C]|nr:hypothetical protein BKI52_17710 [marine bacterium AO1-C]